MSRMSGLATKIMMLYMYAMRGSKDLFSRFFLFTMRGKSQSLVDGLKC